MMTALAGIAVTALLFVLFGGFALADRGGGCHGDCGACASDDCDLDVNRRL